MAFQYVAPYGGPVTRFPHRRRVAAPGDVASSSVGRGEHLSLRPGIPTFYRGNVLLIGQVPHLLRPWDGCEASNVIPATYGHTTPCESARRTTICRVVSRAWGDGLWDSGYRLRFTCAHDPTVASTDG